MKFTLFIVLALCAFTAQASQSFDLAIEESDELVAYGVIADIVAKAVKFVTDAVTTIVKKTKEVVEAIVKGVGDVVGAALGQLLQIAKQIAELAKTGIVARNCIKPHEERIQEILAKVQADVGQCRANAEAEVAEIQRQIEQTVAEIKGYVDELYNVISKCFENGNAASGTLCVVSKVFQIRDKVKAAYEAAEKTILEAQQRATIILENVQICVDEARDKPTQELNEILRNIQQCVAENTLFLM